MKRKNPPENKEDNETKEPSSKRGFWEGLSDLFAEQPDEIPKVIINGFMITISTSKSELFLPARSVSWVRNDMVSGKAKTLIGIKAGNPIILNGHHAKQIQTIWFED